MFFFQSGDETDEIQALLAFGPLVSYGGFTLDDTLEILDKHIINHITQKTKLHKVHYKFHPDEYRRGAEAGRNRVIKIFQAHPNIEFIELETNVFLEGLVYNNKNIIVYNYYSSVGMYAGFFGNKVYSVSKRLDPKIDKRAARKWGLVLGEDITCNWEQI